MKYLFIPMYNIFQIYFKKKIKCITHYKGMKEKIQINIDGSFTYNKIIHSMYFC